MGTDSKKKSTSSMRTKLKNNQKIIVILVAAVGLLTAGILYIYFFNPFQLSSVTTPTTTTETIRVNVINGRTQGNLTLTTDIYVWETINITGFGDGGLNSTLVFSGKASAVNIIPTNSSCIYVAAYNQTGYFTRWAILSVGSNSLTLYENPTEADMFIQAFNRTDYSQWGVNSSHYGFGGEGSLNLSVIAGIGLQDELDADKALVPLYDYSQANYTRIMVNFTFNGTMTHTNVTLHGYNTTTEVIKSNTTTQVTFYFKYQSIITTNYFNFEIEVDSGLNCTGVSWGFFNYVDNSLAYPSSILTHSFLGQQ